MNSKAFIQNRQMKLANSYCSFWYFIFNPKASWRLRGFHEEGKLYKSYCRNLKHCLISVMCDLSPSRLSFFKHTSISCMSFNQYFLNAFCVPDIYSFCFYLYLFPLKYLIQSVVSLSLNSIRHCFSNWYWPIHLENQSSLSYQKASFTVPPIISWLYGQKKRLMVGKGGGSLYRFVIHLPSSHHLS